MDAIENMIEEMNQKGQQEIDAYVEKERSRIDRKFLAEQEQLLIQQEQEISKRQTQLLKEFKQTQQRQTLDIRQTTLNQKQEYLNQLCLAAVTKMTEWSAAEFQQFLAEQLYALPLTGTAEVKLGEQSKEKLSQEQLDQLTTATIQWQLAEDYLPKESGFVVSQNGIEYNFLFKALVAEIQQTEGFKLAAALFQ
jgi:V/A-type H+-transporting ATPase subunit E